ncbi:hypothetical protein HNR44_002421 [Geomicrobium halophilum]|uniref:S-layer homology domain-containing protein n=1 Tax=Geomicrobium halophilum TaxID=549000 RepID=A0A841Q2C5_9BACL|nr:C40 family peptidase [Geomicrobium halophilum]MBB6450438.1 hypothetical protein [Geomicrobium halophilum]
MKKILMTATSVLLALTVFSANTDLADASVSDVIDEAKSHLGVPYQFGGTTPSGFDCSGYLVYIFNQTTDETLPRTAAQQSNYGESISKSDLQKGDLVFFNTRGSGVGHSGMYIGGGEFIHSSASQGISIADIDDPYYWGDRYVGAQRVLEENNKEKVKSETFEPLPDGEYHDVRKSFFAYHEITQLGKDGIINGYRDGTYKPNNQLSRGQAASLLANALDLDTSSTNAPFVDVSPNNHHAGAITAVAEEGLFTGNTDNEFMPADPMTRGHTANVFYHAFDLGGYAYDGSFDDVSDSHQFSRHIDALAGAGITTGNKDGDYEPGRATTRAHFAVFLYESLNL